MQRTTIRIENALQRENDMHQKKEFMEMIGETISMVQTLECDLKWIYAAIMKGEMMDNFNIVASWTLGSTIKALEDLDKTDEDRILTDDDYHMLRHINHMRNEIVHHSFVRFLYTDKQYDSKEFLLVDQEVSSFYQQLLVFSRVMERIRFDVLHRYGRM